MWIMETIAENKSTMVPNRKLTVGKNQICKFEHSNGVLKTNKNTIFEIIVTFYTLWETTKMLNQGSEDISSITEAKILKAMYVMKN